MAVAVLMTTRTMSRRVSTDGSSAESKVATTKADWTYNDKPSNALLISPHPVFAAQVLEDAKNGRRGDTTTTSRFFLVSKRRPAREKAHTKQRTLAHDKRSHDSECGLERKNSVQRARTSQRIEERERADRSKRVGKWGAWLGSIRQSARRRRAPRRRRGRTARASGGGSLREEEEEPPNQRTARPQSMNKS